MQAVIRVPTTSVTIVLRAVTEEDISALMEVLDQDRNHPARAELYHALQRARILLRPEKD